MDALQDQAKRRLRCDAYQASLHCSPTERVQLTQVLAAWKTGVLTLDDAQAAVSALRQRTAA